MEVREGKKRRTIVIAVFVLLIFAFISIGSESYVFAETATGSKVTYKGAVSSMGSTCGKFTIKGHYAFCAEHSKPTPPTGTKITSTKLVTNNTMRKALYYGYGGPKAKVKKNNAGWVSTSIALSRANGKGGGTVSAQKFYKSLKNYAVPPASFKVYYCKTAGGKQALCYWIYSPEGKVRVQKVSSDPAVTADADYSLSGAVYGVYKNKSCASSSKVATLTTGSSGVSQKVTLDKGTYYVKEITAPKGFELSNIVYTVSVTDQCDKTVSVKNVPIYDKELILIQKIDSESGEPIPSGIGELAGAEFTVNYYEGTDWAADPAKEGAEPKSTWVLKSNGNGYVRFGDEEAEVSVDELYHTCVEELKFPVGTFVIKETKAPVGYNLNDEIYLFKVVEDDDVPGVFIDKIATTVIADRPIRGDLEIIKRNSSTGEPMGEITFDVINTADSSVATTLVTDENGYATTATEEHPNGSLLYGDYIVRETETPVGYLPHEDIHVSIDEDNEMITLEIENIPAEIKTNASFKGSDSKEILPTGEVTIVDEVSYKNLIPGTEYTLEGILMDTATGDPLVINEANVTSEIQFIPESTDGSISMEFTFDASELSGRSTTVFEKLYVGAVEVASHEDITDVGQTVGFILVEEKPPAEVVETGDFTDRIIYLTLATLIISAIGALVTVRRGKI